MAVEYFVLELGQSNNEPHGDLAQYLAYVPDMNAFLLTPDVTLGIYYGKAVETIRFLTFYNPEAGAAYPGGSPPAPFASLGYDSYCQFLPWTYLEGASNPNIVGFRYPNAFTLPVGPLGAAYGALMNSAVDLGRRMVGWLGKRINFITLGIPSSQLQFMETQLAGLTAWGWFDPRLHNNWSPGDANGICARLSTVLYAAKLAAAAEGNTLRCLLVTMKQGETDSQNATARALFGTNAATFVAWVRQKLFDLGLVDVPAWQIPFIWPQVTSYPWAAVPTGSVTEINTALTAMAADDPYFWTYSADSFEKNSGDPLHFSWRGHMSLAEADFKGLLAIRSRLSNSFPEAGNMTLAEMRAAVLRLTERNTTDTAQNQDVVDEAINESVQDLVSSIGDTCWWLRLMTPFALRSGPRQPVELPRVVTRLLEIHPAAFPTYVHDYTMLGHSDRGRVQIVTLQDVSSNVVLHHIYEPTRLVADAERILIPTAYLECVKVGAAYRVAASTSNAPLKVELQSRWAELKIQCMSHAQKVDRQRRQRLTGGSRRMRYYAEGANDAWRNWTWQ